MDWNDESMRRLGVQGAEGARLTRRRRQVVATIVKRRERWGEEEAGTILLSKGVLKIIRVSRGGLLLSSGLLVCTVSGLGKVNRELLLQPVHLSQDVVFPPELRVLPLQVLEAVPHTAAVEKRLALGGLPLPQPLTPHDRRRLCVTQKPVRKSKKK